MLAAQQGNIKFCKQLVEKGADVKYKKRGISALDYALSTGEIQDAKTQIKLIEYLYQQKIPVTKMTKRILINGYRTGVYGDTSANTEYILQWGMKQGIVKMKDLSKKRKIFYQISIGQEENADFQNIFDLAIKSNNIDTIKYLMDIIKPSPKDICESIENSIDSISEKTLGYLLTKLTDINISPEDNDENILETAAMSNRIDLAELLIKKKAVVTPIALINAVDTGNIKLVKLLLSNGGEVNKIGKYSDGEKMTSALYGAITLGDFPMVKFLIREGAGDTDIKEAVTDSNSYRIKKYIYQKFPGLQDD